MATTVKTDEEVAEIGAAVMLACALWKFRDRSRDDGPEHPTYLAATIDAGDLARVLGMVSVAAFEAAAVMPGGVCTGAAVEAVELLETEILGRIEASNPEALF